MESFGTDEVGALSAKVPGAMCREVLEGLDVLGKSAHMTVYKFI